MNGLALCAGYGGLELGIERVFPESRTVCYVEGEAFAVQHLVKKMEEGRLDKAPVWSNVKTFDGIPWRGKVDWLSGGFPCQPYSSAGKKMGKEDPRDLWPDFVRIIGEVLPGFLFLENVPNVIKFRLSEIVLDLDKLGYHCSWCVVAASDVGAPHRRRRWFLFGVRHTDTHAKCSGWDENKQSAPEREFDFEGVRGKMAYTDGYDRGAKHSPQSFERNSRLESWGGGKSGDGFNQQWEVEPSMGRLVDGATDWVDKLRLLGNGVVPQQAAYAFQILGERLACGIVENRTPKD